MSGHALSSSEPRLVAPGWFHSHADSSRNALPAQCASPPAWEAFAVGGLSPLPMPRAPHWLRSCSCRCREPRTGSRTGLACSAARRAKSAVSGLPTFSPGTEVHERPKQGAKTERGRRAAGLRAREALDKKAASPEVVLLSVHAQIAKGQGCYGCHCGQAGPGKRQLSLQT